MSYIIIAHGINEVKKMKCIYFRSLVERAIYAEVKARDVSTHAKTIKTLLVENPTSECQEVPEELEKLRSENTKLKYQLGILQRATAEVESKKTKV